MKINIKKKLLTVIKSLSVDILRNNTTEYTTENNEYKEHLLELDILPIDYYDKNELKFVCININFELLDKKTIELLTKNQMKKNFNYYKCYFK